MLKMWVFLFPAAVLLAACLPQSNEYTLPAWVYADLRALDMPSQIPPAQDLIALYTRFVQSEFQVRLDLLDSSPDLDTDFYLALDYQPGGERRLPVNARSALEWDALVSLPATGPIGIQLPGGQSIPGAKLRVTRDPSLDRMVISLESESLFKSPPFSTQRSISLQVFVTPAGTPEVVDSIGPVRSGDPPPGQASVLVALWNTLPATTPAQALRRWNGAHTGPFNARHGLQGVVDAAKDTGFPVALLDLNTPEALSSLDSLGALPQIQELARQELILLPEAVPIKTGTPGEAFQPPGWVFSRAASENRRYSQAFGLPASPFLFIPRLDGLVGDGGYRFIFSLQEASAQENRARFLFSPFRWQDIQVLSLPETRAETSASASEVEPQQVSQDGPSLEVRRALLRAAVDRKPGVEGPVFVLGGDLSRSAWGDPLSARAGLDYLAAHPWIRPLTGYDLLASGPARLPAPAGIFSDQTGQPHPFIPQDALGQPLASGLNTAQIQAQVLSALQISPPGPLTETAWRAYLSLVAPAVPEVPGLPTLRAAYLGQIGPLLAAARWGSQGLEAICSSSGVSPCPADLDWDGQEEIILATDHFLGVIETQGAMLTYAFRRNGSEVHQMIGPSSQFTVGLSDPTFWKPERGVAGDPNGLPGAFADIQAGHAEPSWEPAQVTLSPQSVTFTSPDGTLRKTIRLTPDGLSVAYFSSQPVRVQIPLVIDPWSRFQSDWEDLYQERPEGTGWSWGLVSGPRVIVRTSGELSSQAFNASREAMRLPEDPNFNYSVGHYLPFPMALAEVKGEGEFTINITFLP